MLRRSCDMSEVRRCRPDRKNCSCLTGKTIAVILNSHRSTYKKSVLTKITLPSLQLLLIAVVPSAFEPKKWQICRPCVKLGHQEIRRIALGTYQASEIMALISLHQRNTPTKTMFNNYTPNIFTTLKAISFGIALIITCQLSAAQQSSDYQIPAITQPVDSTLTSTQENALPVNAIVQQGEMIIREHPIPGIPIEGPNGELISGSAFSGGTGEVISGSVFPSGPFDQTYYETPIFGPSYGAVYPTTDSFPITDYNGVLELPPGAILISQEVVGTSDGEGMSSPSDIVTIGAQPYASKPTPANSSDAPSPELVEAQNSIRDLTKKLEASKSELSALNQRIYAAERQTQAAKDESAKKIEELEQQLSSMSASSKNRKGASANKLKASKELEQELRNKIETLEMANAATAKSKDETMKKLALKAKEIKEERDQLKGQLGKMKTEVTKTSEKLITIEGKFKATNKELEQSAAKLATAQSKLKAALTKLSKAEAGWAKAEKEAKSNQSKMLEANKNAEVVKAALTNVKSQQGRVAELESALVEMEKKLAAKQSRGGKKNSKKSDAALALSKLQKEAKTYKGEMSEKKLAEAARKAAGKKAAEEKAILAERARMLADKKKREGEKKGDGKDSEGKQSKKGKRIPISTQIKKLQESMERQIKRSSEQITKLHKKKIEQLIADGKKENSKEVHAIEERMETELKKNESKIRTRVEERIKRLKKEAEARAKS